MFSAIKMWETLFSERQSKDIPTQPASLKIHQETLRRTGNRNAYPSSETNRCLCPQYKDTEFERGIRKARQREGRSHFSTCKGSWRAIWEKQANSPYGTQKRHGDRKISPGVRRVNLNVYTRSSSSPPILHLHPGPKQCVDFSSPSLQKRAEVEFFQHERIEGVCMLNSEISIPFSLLRPRTPTSATNLPERR